MDELKTTHLNAIRQHRTLSRRLRKAGMRRELFTARIEDLRKDEFAELYDACTDVWCNWSPVVRKFTADQGVGDYPIEVRGVIGAYFVCAQEFDRAGPFDTTTEAEGFVRREHGEFLVSGPKSKRDAPEVVAKESSERRQRRVDQSERDNALFLEIVAGRAKALSPRRLLARIKEASLLERLHDPTSVPAALAALLKSFEDSLPPVSTVSSAMDRHVRLRRLRMRALLYVRLRERRPGKRALQRLFELQSTWFDGPYDPYAA